MPEIDRMLSDLEQRWADGHEGDELVLENVLGFVEDREHLQRLFDNLDNPEPLIDRVEAFLRTAAAGRPGPGADHAELSELATAHVRQLRQLAAEAGRPGAVELLDVVLALPVLVTAEHDPTIGRELNGGTGDDNNLEVIRRCIATTTPGSTSVGSTSRRCHRRLSRPPP